MSRDTSSPSSEPPPYSEEKKEPKEHPEPIETAKSVVSDAASAVTAAAVTVKDKAQQELRQRKVSSGATATTPSEKKASPQFAQAVAPTVQGVSVQLTALLCFLSFMIAYLFF